MLRPPGAAVKSFLGSVFSAAGGNAAVPRGTGTHGRCGVRARPPSLSTARLAAPVSPRPWEGKTRVQVTSRAGLQPSPRPLLTSVRSLQAAQNDGLRSEAFRGTQPRGIGFSEMCILKIFPYLLRDNGWQRTKLCVI